MIEDASISDSVIWLRSVIKAGSRLSRVIFMGSDAFETERRDGDGLGIGKNCVIQNAILDKDVRIGDNVQLINKERIINGERDGIIIRDGIIVVPKSTRIPSGFVL